MLLGHAPARILLEVEAKRHLVAEHEEIMQGAASDDWLVRRPSEAALLILDPTLRVLALPYVDHPDHPDHRDTWRP